MNNLQKIEYNNIKVLTSKQLANAYGVDVKIISKNFNNNKNKYIEGKDYFKLEGQSKRDFYNRRKIYDGYKNATTLYLWTESGCITHAKSIGTDEAWKVFNTLKDAYFENKALKKKRLKKKVVYLTDTQKEERKYIEKFIIREKLDKEEKAFRKELKHIYDLREDEIKQIAYKKKKEFVNEWTEILYKLAFNETQEFMLNLIKSVSKEYKTMVLSDYMPTETMNFMINVYNRLSTYVLIKPFEIIDSEKEWGRFQDSIDDLKDRAIREIRKRYNYIWIVKGNHDVNTQLLTPNDRVSINKAKNKIKQFDKDKKIYKKNIGQLELF